MDHLAYLLVNTLNAVNHSGSKQKGQARIRTQMSAAHSREQLDRAIDAFIQVGKDMAII